MKENSNDEIFLNSEKKNKIDYFYECLKFSNSLNYLDKKDILNLAKCSKSTNSFVTHNYLLLRYLLNCPQSQ